MVKKLNLILLGVIIAFAAILRIYNLGNYPVGFQIDEASLGYSGYSILSTGKSDEGKFLPLYVDIFGDNRPSGYHYLTIVPILMFGLSEFSTRLPGAVFGIISIIPVYFLSLFLFRDKRIAVLSAFFISVAPWHVVLSRASAETIVALFLILLGFYFLLNSIKKYSKKQLILSILLLSLSYFFYHTPRVFVPLMVLGTISLFYKEILDKKHKVFKLYFGSLVFLLFFLSFALVFLIPGGSGRFSQVNVFSHPETTLVLAEQHREDGSYGVKTLEARFFHNKLVNFSFDYVSNYLEYFSGDFLFIGGGLPAWYDVDRMGLLYIYQLPFLLFGFFLCAKKHSKLTLFPLFWILLSPVTAAVTVDDVPNLQRAIVLFPMLEIVSAYGLIEALRVLRGKWQLVVKITLSIIVIYSILYFLHQYFVHGYTHRPWVRNNGFSNMMQEVNRRYGMSDKVIMTKTGGGYPLVLFYSKYDPAMYILEGSPKDTDYKGFGKFLFVPQECPSLQSGIDIKLSDNITYVDRGSCDINKGLLNRMDIPREDGSMGFRVYYREGIEAEK